MTDHDYWSPARSAAWAAMTPADRRAEFDARVRAGYPLAHDAHIPGTYGERTLSAEDLREAFADGRLDFGAFYHSEAHPQWPLLTSPAAARPSIPAPAPVAPSAAVPTRPATVPLVAVPVPLPAAVDPRVITASEIFERRRREAAGEPTATPSAPTRSGSRTTAEIFASRREQCEAARAREAARHEPKSSRSGLTRAEPARPKTADEIFAARRAQVENMRGRS